MDSHVRRISTGGGIYSRLPRRRGEVAGSGSSALKPRCLSRRDGSSRPPNNGNNNNNDKGDRQTTDWDKAWSSFRKKGKKGPFSQFNPNKYVSWNPRRSEYPLSEEPNPIKRTERLNLMLWTSPKFTLAGAIVVVTLLLIYTLLALPN
ncbi:hypothetical protein CKAN_00535800 [Cinnamomum micranthum f. kanehirae]|uniref:Uncharacterized protein n=1 Tax=Cinnamomum micranthum f. kanehirae TaxID=337451 RepID=A0A443NED9_9MAGN|nr:hypothetical protein CKAN_00535800 [Cinnamomum micranthum f. kanehirae]